MAIKALLIDQDNTHHLVIGLNRENIESILRGDVFSFPAGYLTGLTEDSDVVVLFAETDNEFSQHFPAGIAACIARDCHLLWRLQPGLLGA